MEKVPIETTRRISEEIYLKSHIGTLKGNLRWISVEIIAHLPLKIKPRQYHKISKEQLT
jgi:hypothetical protein